MAPGRGAVTTVRATTPAAVIHAPTEEPTTERATAPARTSAVTRAGATPRPAAHAAACYSPAMAATAATAGRLLASSAVPVAAPGTPAFRGPTIYSTDTATAFAELAVTAGPLSAAPGADVPAGTPSATSVDPSAALDEGLDEALDMAPDPGAAGVERTVPTADDRRAAGGGVVSAPAVEQSPRRRDAVRRSDIEPREVDPLTSPRTPAADGVAESDAQRQVADLEGELDGAGPTGAPEPVRPEATAEPALAPPEPGTPPAPEPEAPGTPEAGAGAADADVAAWQGRVQAASAALPRPQVRPAATYSEPIAAAGGAGTRTLAAKEQQIPLEAKKVLEARPLKPLPDVPGVPAPDPVPKATGELRRLAVRSLPDQRLPRLVATPHGFLPTVGGPPVDTKAPPTPAPVPKSGTGARSRGPAGTVNDALTRGPAAPAPGEGQVLTGSERAPTPTIAAPHRPDIAKVLARVYLQAQGMGTEVLREARATAYGIDLNGSDQLKDLGKEREEQETVWFRQEIGRVADAASIGKEALDAAVLARARELEKDTQTSAEQVVSQAQEQVRTVTEAGARAQSMAAASYEAWERHFDDLAARAKGDVDPAAVRAEQKRIAEEFRSFAATHTTAWAGMRKIRERDLGRARDDQITAYQRAAVADQEQTTPGAQRVATPGAPAPAAPPATELTDPELQRWVKDRRTEVDKAVTALLTALGRTVDGWTTDLNKARDDGVEAARVWADGRIGRERGWLETLITDWLLSLATKQQDNKALEQAQTDETVAALGGTLQMINDLKLGGLANLDRDGQETLGRMNQQEQALVQAYFGDGAAKGDTVLLLASLLTIRLRRQRAPEAAQYVRDKVQALDNVAYWQALDTIGASQNKSFSAATVADQLWQAFEHTWGTDEEKAFAAVKGGLTVEQSKAVRGAYRSAHGEDLDARMDSELSGTDYQRVKFGFDGRQAEADAAALAEAMGHTFSNDQTLITDTLRNKTDAERKAIAAAYKRLYGKDLAVDFAVELRGDNRAVVTALWQGNTEKADAIEIKQAREAFWGPDHEKIEKVYTRVRDEATRQGDAKGWKTDQINAEIARRTGKMAGEYQEYTKRGLLSDLESSFNPSTDGIWDPQQRKTVEQYWAGRRDLVMGLATGDLVRADAGKIQIERTGVYAKDETVNKVLALQYSRAYDNARRDAIVDFAAKNRRQPNKEELKQLEQAAEASAKRTGTESMGRLGSYFEKNYTGGTVSFRDTIADLTQGVDEEKALSLVGQGGFLEDWQVLEYATKGAGTDEDEFKRVLKKQKTKADQDRLQSTWQLRTGTTRTIADLIDDETSGRLKNDLLLDNKFGGEPDDPAVLVEKATAQLDFERRSGGQSTYVDNFGRVRTVKNHEYVVLEQRLAQLKAAADARDRTSKLPDDDPRKTWAQAQLDQGTQAFASGIETHRFLVDQRTELAAQVISMAVAITVAVLITVATGGVGSVAGAALIAGVSSLFGAAAGIATKMSMKGEAYGADELGVDIALGVVDVAVSAATAGFGGKLIKGATAAAKAGGASAKGALVTLGRMAEGSALNRAAAHAIAEGAEGFLQSLPTAVLGTALNEKTWTEGNPLFNMLAGVGVGAAMGTFASGTIGGLTNLRGPKGVHVPEPGNVPAIKGRLVDLVPGTAEHAHLQARYFELNPNRTAADFQRDLDGLVMLQAKHNPEVKARLESRLRSDIGDLLPAGQRSAIADSPVEMWDTKRFEEFTGSRTGQAVVIIKDGRPTVIVKQGADPHEIAQEGFHLLQALDPKTRPKIARLDESVLSRWSSLDVRERLALYKEKLDLELDAQRKMVGALAERAAPGRVVDPETLERLARARETLANLERRAVDLSRIGPLQRQLLGWGVLQPPQWLDQPARLFSKTQTPGRARKTGGAGTQNQQGAPKKPAPAPPQPTPPPPTPAQIRQAQIDQLWAEQRKLRRLPEPVDPANKQAQIEALWQDRAADLPANTMKDWRVKQSTETAWRRQLAEEQKVLDQLTRLEATEAANAKAWAKQRRRDAELAEHYRQTLVVVDKNGPRFKDAATEAQYQAYLQRKQAYAAREGFPNYLPRPREDWKVQVEYWATEHPTARGNAFNATRRGTFTFDEVAVDNPKGGPGSGYGHLRVDSYHIDPRGPQFNMIISRKATDIDMIDEATFVAYLDELVTKYKPGTVITSQKELAGVKLTGQTLQGKQYLELPSSNQAWHLTDLRQRYEQLAKNRGIEIIYADE